jgi:hypothetical protein
MASPLAAIFAMEEADAMIFPRTENAKASELWLVITPVISMETCISRMIVDRLVWTRAGRPNLILVPGNQL